MSDRPAYIESIEGNIKTTTFKMEEPKSQIIIEQIHKKGFKTCLLCKKEFEYKSNNHYYCSNCRYDRWLNYMCDRQRNDKKEEMMFIKLSKLSPEQIDKFDDLINRQQFVEDVPIKDDNNCLICNSNRHLVKHHISYVPVEKVIVCKSCHVFLHCSLLKRRKCRP